MKKQILYIAIFILVFYKLEAVDNSFSLFLNSEYGLNYHISDFNALPGYNSCCPSYRSGYGLGYGLNTGFQLPINTNTFIGAKLFFNETKGFISSLESTYVVINLEEKNAVIEHSIDTKFYIAGISPFLGYKLKNGFEINFGLNIGYTFNSSFHQKEQIVEPQNTGYFKDNNSRIRNEFSGELPKLSKINFALESSINYNLKLNRRENLVLTPELNLSYYFTNVIENISWNIFKVNFGIGLKYTILDIPKKYYEKYYKDTIKYFDNTLVNEIFKVGAIERKITENEFTDSIVYVYAYFQTDTIFKPKTITSVKKGKQIDSVKISEIKPDQNLISKEMDFKKDSVSTISDDEILKAQERVPIYDNGFIHLSEYQNGSDKLKKLYLKGNEISEFENLINYIFFDENSDLINEKYLKENYIFSDISNRNYQYSRIFQIIAENLKLFDRITILGAIDPISEKNNCELASKRSRSVKEFLVKYYSIPQEKIVIMANNKQCIPNNPVFKKDILLQKLNRRVEINYEKNDIRNLLLEKNYLSNSKIFPNSFFIIPKEKVSKINFSLFSKNENLINYTNQYKIDITKNDIEKINKEKCLNIKATSKLEDLNEVISEIKLPVLENISKKTNYSFFAYGIDFNKEKLNISIKNNLITFLSKIDNNYLINIRGNMNLLDYSLENKKLINSRIFELEKFIRKNKPNVKVFSNFFDLNTIQTSLLNNNIPPEEIFLNDFICIQAIKIGNDYN